MELNDWIDSVGGTHEAAEKLGENHRTVYAWYRLEKAPRLSSVANIIAVSGQVLDCNDIYMPFIRDRFDGAAK